MRTALIGHRGVGKSSLLARIEAYYREAERTVLCLDLDRIIEERTGRSISDTFAVEGEEAFRKIEKETFLAIDRETVSAKEEAGADVFLALGAGFDPAFITDSRPESWKVLWIRRDSDQTGRIFADRPRLNPSLHPLDEFRERSEARQAAYRARADETLWLDEGGDDLDPAERAFFTDKIFDLGGAITVKKEIFRTVECFENWFKRRLEWGVRFFELRDDLLSREEIERALRILPPTQALLSFREPKAETSTAELVKASGCAFDWPLERGPKSPVSRPANFLSLHERRLGETLTAALQRLSEHTSPTTCLKAALPVRDFNELMQGHRWFLENVEGRAFLPLSLEGRWSWYRELVAERPALNFIREDEGSGPDQPTLLRWIRRRRLGTVSNFAAVLGDPVGHSRTPLEHRDFFQKRNAPAFAIRVMKEEWLNAIQVLEDLGLRWAAVTAPLKELAYKGCRVSDDLSSRLLAVNTLVCTNGKIWQGMNTDHEGFINTWREAVGPISMATAIWGGGGTLEVMRAILPKARLYSARTGEPRTSYEPKEFEPEVVVWAAGRIPKDQPMPPVSWRPSIVFDLSYTEDSSGRAFALERGARYVSGVAMFRSQAAAQRRFWDACDGMAYQSMSTSLKTAKGT